MKRVGSYLREGRLNQGIGLRVLAARIPMHFGALSQVELGYRRLSPAYSLRIARMLNLDLERLRDLDLADTQDVRLAAWQTLLDTSEDP